PHDADEALPGLALLLAQGAADVAQDQELVRQSPLPEGAAADLEPPGPSGKGEVEDRRGVRAQAAGEPQLGGVGTRKTLDRAGQKALAGPVHESQPVVAV